MRIKFYAFFIHIAFCLFACDQAVYAALPVQWGTYHGGEGQDAVATVITDRQGNVYIAGSTRSVTGIGTSGTYLSAHPGGINVGFVAKYNNAGARIWGTYVPGEVYNIACDGNGDIYAIGKVGNTIASIATPGSHQNAYAGDFDAYLLKLNGGNGQRLWGTYYGGDKEDMGYAVAVDGNNDIYIAGVAESNIGIATSGSHRDTKANSIVNFFLAKFTTSGTRLWGTYYGNNLENELRTTPAISLAVGPDDNVYMSGTTASSSGIATMGSFKPFKAGGTDVFIAKFNQLGVRQWGTYYGGTADEKGSDIVVDYEGALYITGYTRSGTDIATAGTYQTDYMPDANQPASDFNDNMFVARFNSSGFLNWGTYYKDRVGLPPASLNQNVVSRIAYDVAGYICLAGAKSYVANGTSFASFNTSLARFHSNTGQLDMDTAVAEISKVDIAGGIATDASGNIFIGGLTESQTNIATAGSPQSALGGAYDGFLMKFRNADTTVYFKNLFSVKGVMCIGDTFSIPYGVTYDFNTANVFTAQLYDVIAGTSFDIGTATTATAGSIFCTIDAGIPFGSNYKIRIIASDPADTTIENSLNISINRAITATAIADRDTVCEGDVINLRAAVFPPGSYKYAWNGPDTFKFDVATPMILKSPLAAAGSYILKVTNEQGGCLVQDTVIVGVIGRPLPPVASCDSPVCENDTLFLRAFSNTPGATYHWSGPNGFSEGTVMNELARYNVGLDATGIYRVAAFIEECPSTDVFVSTTIKPMPRFSVSSNTPVCEDDTLRLFVESTGDSSYRWEGPWDYATDSTNPVIAPVPLIMSGDYRVYTYLDGCGGYATTPVRIKPKPKVKVTNNSPLFEGEDLKFLMQQELYPGASYFWTGPDSFKSPEREPSITRASDSASGTYHIVTTLEGCTYTTLTTVIIYSRDNQYFKLYPSPNTGDFTVEGIVKYDQTMHFEVANSANQVIGRDFIETDNRSFKTEINMAGKLSHGQYYFRIWINGAWETIPFTIIY